MNSLDLLAMNVNGLLLARTAFLVKPTSS